MATIQLHIFTWFVILLQWISVSIISAQDENVSINPQTIFQKISLGIENGNVSEFSEFLSSQVYLSLNTGEQGYYSRNQVFYILKDYFLIYKAINFKVTSKLINNTNPYLAAKFNYESRGRKGSAKVYVSLTFIENRWEITQITFN